MTGDALRTHRCFEDDLALAMVSTVYETLVSLPS